jgi:hypothetical protein
MTRRIRVYVVWGVLAVLAAGIYVLQSREPEPYIAPEDQRRLFGFQEADIGQIDMFYKGRLASLLRSPGGRWFQHDASHRHDPNPNAGGDPTRDGAANAGSAEPKPPPEAVPAGTAVPGSGEPHPEPDAGKAEELARAIDFLARTVFDRRITPTEPLKEYGLDNPQIVIIFYPRNPDNSAGAAPLTWFYVGSPLSHLQSYYAQLSGDRDIALIPLYQVNTLTALAYGEVAQAPLRDPALKPTNR